MPLKPTSKVHRAFGGQRGKGMKGGSSSLAQKYETAKVKPKKSAPPKMSAGLKSGPSGMR